MEQAGISYIRFARFELYRKHWIIDLRLAGFEGGGEAQDRIRGSRMKSVAETIFFDSGIPPDLFGQYAIQIGDKDWWDEVGIEPPRLAENRSGMICIKAGRLVVLAAGILNAWNVSDEDALVLIGGKRGTGFEKTVDRARMVLFASTYSVLAYSSEVNSTDTWFRRPCVLWDGATPLDVMLKDAGGLTDVFGYLETAATPVTYLAAEHDCQF